MFKDLSYGTVFMEFFGFESTAEIREKKIEISGQKNSNTAVFFCIIHWGFGRVILCFFLCVLCTVCLKYFIGAKELKKSSLFFFPNCLFSWANEIL